MIDLSYIDPMTLSPLPSPPISRHMLALNALVRDFLPILEIGVPESCLGKSAHDQFVLMAYLQDARDIAALQWGTRGIITAYDRMAFLTPCLELGLRDGQARTTLRDKGYTSPLTAWRNVFADFGMNAVHANTGRPTWSGITSC